MTLLDRARQDKSPPLWLMRQAGRYLPEYREVRQHFSNFLEFCYTPEQATKVTLQPIERFGFDAAIIFSDILVVPDALGQEVTFIKGEGPQLGSFDMNIFKTSSGAFLGHLNPVFKALKKVRASLPPEKSLIGFCGAPWTVATYMIEGGGSKDHALTKTFASQDLERFDLILDQLACFSANYLCKQVEAGADTLQIFDSWSSSVPAGLFERWITAPTAAIVQKVREVHPDVDIIGFPKGAGLHLQSYAEGTKVDGLGLDYTLPLESVVEAIPEKIVLQGNLDPTLLVAGGEVMAREVQHIHSVLRERPYIFNLGHGILQQTPVQHVYNLVEQVRSLGR